MKNQKKKKQEFSALTDAGRKVDQELQRLIDYVNNKLVPATRENTEVILRRASEKLKEMADRLAADAAGPKAEAKTAKAAEKKK